MNLAQLIDPERVREALASSPRKPAPCAPMGVVTVPESKVVADLSTHVSRSSLFLEVIGQRPMTMREMADRFRVSAKDAQVTIGSLKYYGFVQVHGDERPFRYAITDKGRVRLNNQVEPGAKEKNEKTVRRSRRAR